MGSYGKEANAHVAKTDYISAVSTVDSRGHSTADSEQLGALLSPAEITSIVVLDTTKGQHKTNLHDQVVIGSYNATTGSYRHR